MLDALTKLPKNRTETSVLPRACCGSHRFIIFKNQSNNQGIKKLRVFFSCKANGRWSRPVGCNNASAKLG